MNRNVQLRIASPCDEDWSAMWPEEKGRFCGACSKTVVDFSMMTDEEVIQFLGRAGQNVCGRFAEEQLERDYSLVATDRRRGWRGWWHWLVAGLLVTAEARGQVPVKTEVVKVERVKVGEKASGDSIKVKVLDTVKVICYGMVRCRRVMGAVSVRMEISRESIVKDSLAAVGLLPKPEPEIYPNPVRRGGTFTLNWRQSEPGSYDVSIYNASGALVEHRKIEVGGKEQIDLLSLPPALPAGMYFLRASRPGAAKVIITLRIIVV
jgi:hypothetical protein